MLAVAKGETLVPVMASLSRERVKKQDLAAMEFIVLEQKEMNRNK